ncbi:MAG: nucleotide exchange factor GrpE [Victivallaceae bacterium]|nr:nucleotide exchange factor GrpE [Victivallaceae bacterium]
MKKKKEVTEPVDKVKPETIDAGTEATPAAETVGKEPSAEKQIETLNAELAEARDALLRLKADFQNYRMRTAKEIANARTFAQSDTIMPFLQVFDHFNMAMEAAEKSDNMDAIKQGLEMILVEYRKRLDELGVEPFDAVGKKFDPKLHDAMSHEASDEVEEGHVIRQWNTGYKLGERLLRPATVVVSSGPDDEEDSEN